MKSSQDLLSRCTPGIDWAIKDILPVGLNLTGADPKAGKSWLWLQVARAMINGGELFGYKVKKTGDVVYLGLEDSEARLANRIKLQGWGHDKPLHNVIFYTMDDFSSKEGVLNTDRMEGLLTDNTVLLVIDTFSSAFSLSQTSVQTVREPFVTLRELAKKRGCCITLVDHKNKGGKIFGSVAKTGFADSIWLLNGSVKKGEASLIIDGKDTMVDNIDLVWMKDVVAWQEGDLPSELQNTTNPVDSRTGNDGKPISTGYKWTIRHDDGNNEEYSLTMTFDHDRMQFTIRTEVVKPSLMGFGKSKSTIRAGHMSPKQLVKLLNIHLHERP